MRVSYELSDDEWRKQRFSEADLASARKSGKVSLEQLQAALERWGPDGILESAIMLTRDEFEELEGDVKRARGKSRARR